MDLTGQFHSEHQQVVDALFQLRQAITARDIQRVQNILAGAEGPVGLHFKFEELYLYPALDPFFGEAYGKQVLTEDDGAFRSIRKIAELAQKTEWNDADHASALANLELIYEHPISCDGLSLWIERRPTEDQEDLFQKRLAVRKQGTKLFEYYHERQPAQASTFIDTCRHLDSAG